MLGLAVKENRGRAAPRFPIQGSLYSCGPVGYQLTSQTKGPRNQRYYRFARADCKRGQLFSIVL